MKTFKIEVSREVICLDSAFLEIEADSLEEAKNIALKEAEYGEIEFALDEFPSANYEAFEVEED